MYPVRPVHFSSLFEVYRPKEDTEMMMREGGKPLDHGFGMNDNFTYFWVPDNEDGDVLDILHNNNLDSDEFRAIPTEEAIGKTDGNGSQSDLDTREGRQQLAQIAGFKTWVEASGLDPDIFGFNDPDPDEESRE